MFQTVMIVAIPALVTLTAAFFLLRKISKANSEQEEQWQNFASRSTSNSDRLQDGKTRQRNSRSRVNTEDTRECAICFGEALKFVELRPCGHTNICRKCVSKLTPKICPFCRIPITEYFY